MKTRIAAKASTIALIAVMTGCGSNETPNGQNTGGAAATGTTGGSGATAGSGATGVGGTNTAGSPAGGMQATGGAAPSGGTGGSVAGGSAGADGGTGNGTSGGTGGSGATGGAGAAGSGAGGGTATAAFTVKSELASQVMASAPTTVGIVTWSVDAQGLTSAFIDFGLTTAYGMRAPVDLAEMSYRTLLLGMKPASTYHFRITATAGSTSYVSNDYTIQTGAATTAVQVSGFREMSATARKRGFIVTSYWNGNGSAVPFILDADGAIVWWATSGPSGGVARAAMSADGKNMWLITANNMGGPLMRVRMDGLERQTYASTTGSHDITPVSGATMAYLDYSETDCDSIFEIDPSGTTREIWDSQGVVATSGCHGNALRYSQAEDVYTFSDVRQDVLVVSRAGALQWRLSERTMGGNAAWGGTSHGHQLLDASILVFANVGGGQGVSDFIEYNLMGQQIQRYTGGGFSANLGDVQRLPGGNTLITYSNDSLIREIDAQRNPVLDIDGGSSRFGYALWRETLYGPPPDISQ